MSDPIRAAENAVNRAYQAAAEVRRLRAEVSALAEADQIRDLEMQRIERLLPKDHDEDKEPP